MHLRKLCLLVVTTFIGSFAQAAKPRLFQIHSMKPITPNVERLYGQDGGAFGTIFCNENESWVMFVDSRVPHLDGKKFNLPSKDECKKQIQQARHYHKKCAVYLALREDGALASINSDSCY